MSDKRDRIATVLRVRRVQELQAAGELARSQGEVTETERVLGALQRHYEANRELDADDGLVPARLRDHELRAMHARAIQRGRERVRAAIEDMEQRRGFLVERTQAVRAMERLDERIAEEDDAEARRAERREMDERGLVADRARQVLV